MRNSSIILVAVAATIAITMPARAQDDECANAQSGQAGLNECYDKVFKKSDAELNKLYCPEPEVRDIKG